MGLQKVASHSQLTTAVSLLLWHIAFVTTVQQPLPGNELKHNQTFSKNKVILRNFE